MQKSLAKLVANVDEAKQGEYLLRKYKSGQVDWQEIISLEIPVRKGSNAFYYPDLVPFLRYFIFDSEPLTKELCLEVYSLFPEGQLPVLNKLLGFRHGHPHSAFFVRSCAEARGFLSFLYDDVTLSQMLALARKLAVRMSYEKQIDAYLANVDYLWTVQYERVFLLARAGNLSTVQLEKRHPILLEPLEDEF